MNEAEKFRAVALMHHQMASTVLQMREGVIPEPTVMFMWVGGKLKGLVAERDPRGMGNKEFGLAVDAALRELGYQIVPLPDDEPAE